MTEVTIANKVDSAKNNWLFSIEMEEGGNENQLQKLIESAGEMRLHLFYRSEMYAEFLSEVKDIGLNRKIQALTSIPGVKSGKWIKMVNSRININNRDGRVDKMEMEEK